MAKAGSGKANTGKPVGVRVSLVAGEVAALASKQAPTEFRVFKAGWNEALQNGILHRWYVDADNAASTIAQFKQRARDMVIDYEHQTHKGGKAPAAGWVPKMDWREGDGMWVESKWTPAAQSHIENGEYRYFSPTFVYDKNSGRLEKIISIALTNDPATLGAESLAAKDGSMIAPPNELLEKLGLPEGSDWSAIYDVIGAIQGKQIDDAASIAMCKDIGIEGVTDFKTLLAKVGEVAIGAKAMSDQAAKDKADATTLAAKANDDAQVALKAANDKIAVLEAKDKERDLETFFAKGTNDAKIDANNRELAEFMFKADPVKAQAWLEKAPKVVVLASLSGGGRPATGAATGLDSDPIMLKAENFDPNGVANHQKILARMAENKNKDYVGAARELNLA